MKSDVLVLAADDLRIDYHRSVQAPDGTLAVELEAAAEMTRYHCLMVRRTDGQWFVMCENLELALPLLPTLGGWHWSYIQGKLRDNGRTSMAMTLLMQHVHDTVKP
jgi:hypothetical protein